MQHSHWRFALTFVAALLPLAPIPATAQNPVFPTSGRSANRIPPTAVAKTASATTGFDVELSSTGRFHSQVVDTSGQPKVNETIRLLHRGEVVGAVRTNASGEASFDGVRGGVHQISVGESIAVVRCWRAETAPPIAQKSLLLVSDGKTIRGQHHISHMVTNPIFLGAALIAALAIPIAINNSDNARACP